MPGIQFDLQHPITIDGQEVTHLELRRPKVRDLRNIDKVDGDINKSVQLIANLAEITPDQVLEIDAEDFATMSKELAGFFGGASPA